MSHNLPAWQDLLPAAAGLPELREALSADVCVVGLGGSGLAAIRRLQEHGLNVIGVDAGPVAGAAAGRNGGLLLAGTASFHHDAVRELGETEAIRWYLDTAAEVQRMLQETPDHARRTGSLRIAADDAELADCNEQLAVMQSHGLPAEAWSGPEGNGLLFREDAVFNPLGRNRELAGRAVRTGARLFTGSPVLQLERGLVSCRDGSVSCAHVIVAVDGGLARLLPELEGDVRPLRLQMLATAPTEQLLSSKPVYYRYGFEYWQQLQDGRVLLGGFRDAGGETEWNSPPVPGGTVQEKLEEFLRNSLNVNAPITHRWAATVGYRNSVLPYFGSVRTGVTALGGYNGTGNVIGSLLGRRAADGVIAAG